VVSPAINRSNRRGARPPMHSITTPAADSSRTKSTTGAAISLGVEPPPGHTSGALGLRGRRRLALEAVRRFPRMRPGAGPVGAGVTLSRSRPTAFPPRRRALPARRGRRVCPPTSRPTSLISITDGHATRTTGNPRPVTTATHQPRSLGGDRPRHHAPFAGTTRSRFLRPACRRTPSQPVARAPTCASGR
jgi:hypothetical protein